MLRSKSFRLLLVIVLLGGILAIAVNFISRSSPEQKGKHADLLKPEQSRSLTDAVYQERKDGTLKFEVRADWSAEAADGVISLKNVGLTRFDAEGKPSNLVSGKEALYDREGKQIRVSGDVRLRLADGTDVYSNTITADLKTEVVNISEKFRFVRGDASGSGQSLEYRIAPKQVDIRGQFYLTLPVEQGQTTIEANEAFHDLNAHTVDLTGNAKIVGQGNRLSAGFIKVEMTEQNNHQQQAKRLRSQHVNLDYSSDWQLLPMAKPSPANRSIQRRGAESAELSAPLRLCVESIDWLATRFGASVSQSAGHRRPAGRSPFPGTSRG